MIPYLIDGLTASTPGRQRVNPTSIAQLYLNNASKSALEAGRGHDQRSSSSGSAWR